MQLYIKIKKMKVLLIVYICFFEMVLISCKSTTPLNNDNIIIETEKIKTSLGNIFVKKYINEDIKKPNLIFVLHGDAPNNPPNYQYKFCNILSKKTKNSIVVSILRPGYVDINGNKSDGKRGLATGDNYTEEVSMSIIESIEILKNRYKSNNIILIGHSGGAAISANIVCFSKNLVNKVFLISCPCDLEQFRNHMASIYPDYLPWKDEVKSISAIDILNNIDMNSEINIIHGKEDEIVPFSSLKIFINKLLDSKNNVNFYFFKDKQHEILLNDEILNIIFEKVTYK